MGSELMVSEIAISLPFSFDSFKKVGTTIDQRKLWADRVRSIVGTSLRERVMRPTLGTTIPFALFETESDAEIEIKTEIKNAFASQLPLLTLQEVNISFDESLNTITTEVVYAIPNDVIVTTIIGFVTLQGKLPIIEELL